MRFVGEKHVFPFCTHNTSWFNFLPDIIPLLQERGLIVIGWGDWFGSAFGPLGEPTPYMTDGHPDEIDLKDAEAFGREIVWRSQKIYAGDTSLMPGDPPPLPPGEDRMPPPETLNDEERAIRMPFRLIFDKEKCLYPQCRLCMDNCPMDGIDLSMNPPVIGKPCMTCMMCDQLCPTGAILVDDAQMKWHKKIEVIDQPPEKSSYKIRYERLLKDYPKFRPLVPEKEFWGWQTQVYTTYTKHPRFVIGKGRIYGLDPWSWGTNEKRGKPDEPEH